MQTKIFVCLGKSIREGGFCIAGKEIAENHRIESWFRPVGREKESIPRYIDTECISVLDIVSCLVEAPAPIPTQPENFTLARYPNWKLIKRFPDKSCKYLVDTPETLWGYGYSSQQGLNDRIPEEKAPNFNASLYFIHVNDAILIPDVSTYRTYQKIRMVFHYNNIKYSLIVTYNVLTEKYYYYLNNGENVRLPPCYITLSLAKPYDKYCYKLVVGYVEI